MFEGSWSSEVWERGTDDQPHVAVGFKSSAQPHRPHPGPSSLPVPSSTGWHVQAAVLLQIVLVCVLLREGGRERGGRVLIDGELDPPELIAPRVLIRHPLPPPERMADTSSTVVYWLTR